MTEHTEKKEKRGFSNFGFSTILLSFVMICVVTFSALSLVTAHSDYKLSKKVADKTSNYYSATERAYDTLAAVDNLLTEAYSTSTDATSYYANIKNLIADYGFYESTDNISYLSYEEQIATDHYLSVKLSIHYPTEVNEPLYEIIEWKSVYKMGIPEDGTLNLIQ